MNLTAEEQELTARAIAAELANAAARERIQELEGQAAAMREALQLWVKHADTIPSFTEEELDRLPVLKVYLLDVAVGRHALSTDAGKGMLERLEEMERWRAEWDRLGAARAAAETDRLNQAYREKNEQAERAEAAERERDQWKAEAEWTERLRAQAQEQMRERCAKVAEDCDWLAGPPEGKSSSLRETIAAAIRALELEGT